MHVIMVANETNGGFGQLPHIIRYSDVDFLSSFQHLTFSSEQITRNPCDPYHYPSS